MKPSNKKFILKIFLPSILVIGIYIFSLFWLIIPTIKKTIFDHKKEVIRELVNSTADIIGKFQEKEQSGALTREEAQFQALDIIKSIRYGKNNKDYFWISNLDKTMVMHPYRPDMVGSNLKHVKDADGVPIFKSFVEIVTQQKMGFAEYRWQLHDQKEKVIPKLSFVMGVPWGWILGTGVYIEDIKFEISVITERLLKTSALIITLLIIILIFTLKQSYKIELQKQMTEEKNTELAKLNATKDKFFSIVAHDLRGPLGHISGFAEVLEQDLTESEPDLVSALEFSTIIRQSVGTIFLFLENLLLWARVQSHKLERKVELFDIDETIDENIELLKGLANSKNISLSKNYIGEFLISSDKNMLSTVIRNLISNSIKFTPEDGDVLIDIKNQTDSYLIQVSDTGVGMESNALSSLFQEDKILSTDGTAKEKGTGLGLIICRDFVNKNGGEIWATSDVGKGSIFNIKIPKEFFEV